MDQHWSCFQKHTVGQTHEKEGICLVQKQTMKKLQNKYKAGLKRLKASRKKICGILDRLVSVHWFLS